MFEYLERLRQKPVKARKRVAFLTALSVALVILGVWITIVYPDFTRSQDQQAKALSTEPSPLSTFGDTLSNGASAIGSQFNSLKDTVSSLASSTTAVNATSSVEFSTSTSY